MRESNAITTRTIPCWKLFSLKYSGAVHGRMLRGKSRSISVSTGDRILDRPQMLGAVGSMGVLLHSGVDDGLAFGTSRWRPSKGYERNCASLGLEEDQSCGFSGIFDGRTNVVKPDPAWRSGGTTLQGHSTQQFTTAEPIRVDHSRRVELVLRLVARDGEKDLEFPKGKCKPMSTLTPPPVQE